MKQKFWSFGDDFIIRDEDGEEIYLIEGKVLSFGDKLSFQNMEGEELAFISERLLTWGPTYEIHRPGEPTVMVKKELFTFFSCKYTVDGPGDRDYEATGDFMDHEYEIQGPSGRSAQVSKHWFSWTDSYGIEVEEGEDEVLMLAVAVVIDLVCHSDQGAR